MEKTKVSPFEYAIISAIEPEKLDQYETITREEQLQQRIDNLKSQAENIRIINHD